MAQMTNNWMMIIIIGITGEQMMVCFSCDDDRFKWARSLEVWHGMVISGLVAWR